MRKSAKSSTLLSNTDVTSAVQRAIEAAIAAALQEQKRRPVKPPPPASEVAKVAADPTKPPRDRRGFRGTPPPATFDLYALPDTALLTEFETAAAARLSTNTLATWRKRPDHLLKWTVIGGGRIRYRVAAVKQYLATGHRPQPGRPRKKADAAPVPKRTPAKPPAQPPDAPAKPSASPRRRARPREKADDLAAPQEPSS